MDGKYCRWRQTVCRTYQLAMGAMAKSRCVHSGEGAFELREAQSGYNAIFEHENRDIDPK